jgi:hypothetical protein
LLTQGYHSGRNSEEPRHAKSDDPEWIAQIILEREVRIEIRCCDTVASWPAESVLGVTYVVCDGSGGRT